MTRFLIKPLVYLLIFGLFGCTSTRWTAMNEPAGEEPIDRLRVTLTDGDRIDLRFALVTDESVSGMRNYRNKRSQGKAFTVLANQVQSLEIGESRTDAGKTGAFIIIMTPVAGFIICSFSNCLR